MSYRSQWVDQYVHHLDCHGISSPESYLNNVLGEDEIPEQLDEYFSEIAFQGLTRFMPETGQDIASVFTNPRLSFSGDLRESTNVILSNEDLESESFSRISWDATAGWIRRKDKIRSEYYEVARALNQANLISPSAVELKSEKTTEGDEFDEYLDGEFINQVYLTNWFKFATPSDEDIPSTIKDERFITEILNQELRQVDPTLVMVFGSTPWKKSFRDTADPVTTDTVPSRISEVHGHLFRDLREDVDWFIIPFIHPSAWNRNLHHLASEDTPPGQKTESGKKEARRRLEKSLSYVNSALLSSQN